MKGNPTIEGTTVYFTHYAQLALGRYLCIDVYVLSTTLEPLWLNVSYCSRPELVCLRCSKLADHVEVMRSANAGNCLSHKLTQTVCVINNVSVNGGLITPAFGLLSAVGAPRSQMATSAQCSKREVL